MRVSTAAVILAAAGVSAQDAPTEQVVDAAVITNNPPGVVYKATLPETAFAKNAYPNGGNVKGEVYALSSPDGVGVIFKIKLADLPSEGGPFIYHIHDKAVTDSNCTTAMAHLDPYKVGESHVCDPSAPQTCQVGDLSGKHGSITDTSFDATYTDEYASLVEGTDAFFGSRSIVIHFANKTRITCANFDLVDSCSTDIIPPTIPSTPVPTVPTVPTVPSGGNGTVPPSPPTPFVQAAGNVNSPSALIIAGVVALAYLL